MRALGAAASVAALLAGIAGGGCRADGPAPGNGARRGEAAAWRRITELAQPLVSQGDPAHLLAAVSAHLAGGADAEARALVELNAWARAGGGLPPPADELLAVVPRGLEWYLLGEDLLTADALRDQVGDPLLYLAYRMREEGPTLFEVTLGQALALEVVHALGAATPPSASTLAPTDDEVVRALAADAVVSVRLGVRAVAGPKTAETGELDVELPELAASDAAALRSFHVAVLGTVPGDGGRAAWLARIREVANGHSRDRSAVVRHVVATLPSVAEKMFRTVDEYRDALAAASRR